MPKAPISSSAAAHGGPPQAKKVIHIEMPTEYIAVGKKKPVTKPHTVKPMPLRKGRTGDEVIALQRRLVELGFRVQADGDFGALTERQLRDFQKKQGLLPTGVLDARTQAELDSPGNAHANALETIVKLRLTPGEFLNAMARKDHSHSKPIAALVTSDQGKQSLKASEIGPNLSVALRPSCPGGSSGVTIAAGYDMGSRSPEQVEADLKAAGVPAARAAALAEGAGAGLTGAAATTWSDKHKELTLTKEQAEKLFERVLKDYEGYVRAYVKIDLLPGEFDALVSFTYNAGPGAMQAVAQHLNNGDVEQALHTMEQRLTKKDAQYDRLRIALAHRRHDEVHGFLYAK